MQRCSITTPQQQPMPQSASPVGLGPSSLPELGLGCSQHCPQLQGAPAVWCLESSCVHALQSGASWCGHGAIIAADLTAAHATVAELTSSIAWPGDGAVAAWLTHKGCGGGIFLLHDPWYWKSLIHVRLRLVSRHL